MMQSARTGRAGALVALSVVVLAVIAAGSSNDSKDSSSSSSSTTKETTTTTSGDDTEETVAFDKTIQAELAEVGCYKGADDGIIGPETDAAIVAFQKASGLTVDGEFGVETESALREAVSAGKKVCDSSTPAVPSGGAACTAAAIGPAIAPATLLSYRCGGGFASGAQEEGGSQGFDAAFLLQAKGGSWAKANTGEACAAGNPLKIPQSVLEGSPCEGS